MQEAVPVGVGAMAAILGLETEDVISSCRQASATGIVEPANLNCPGQVVIAGEVRAVESAIEICKSKGAKRALLLPVSAPFHCSMLKPAGEKLKKELEPIELKDMNIPVIANVSAEYISDKKYVKESLIRQVSSPVLWEKSIRLMLANGIDIFIEIGPGKALSGFVKKINKDVKTLNIEDMASLEATLKEI